MDKKEEFKEFVKKNPRLLTFVKKGEMTWQKFYEMFDLYGENNSIWDDYLKVQEIKEVNTSFDFLKNIDLDSIQNGAQSLQRVLGLLGELSTKSTETTVQSEYQPRPLYKHFED